MNIGLHLSCFFQADKPEVAVGQVLIEEEKMEIGGVKWSVYRYYGKSVGVAWTCTCLFMFLLYQAFQLGGNIWLSGNHPLNCIEVIHK